MRRAEPGPLLPIAIGTGLLAALVSLAILQYRWTARLSEAERERLQASLDSAASRFCDALDRELTRASRDFQPGDGLAEEALTSDLAARLSRWRSTAPEPGLVWEVLVVTRLGRGEVELRRLDEANGQLGSMTWERGLESVRRIFEARGRVPVLDEVLPGLILPVRAPPARDGEPEEPGARRPPRDHVVVRLDPAFLAKDFLPRVAEREFGGKAGLVYAVVVRGAQAPRAVVFQGGPNVANEVATVKPDAVQGLFALRLFPDLTDVPSARRPPRREGPGREQGGRGGEEPARDSEVGRWVLEVRHPSGSLETAVAGARRRNLGISLGVLLLLGTTTALLVASTRRAQRLARQQMDFVAAVSHELKTPLTAMRSAGQNLADGIVDDPDKVRKYGALIEREGRRLTEMVSRVLAFSGIRSGSQSFRVEPVSVRSLVDGILADARWVLEERHVQVECDVAEGIPDLRGDEGALRQALANLLDNAMKYGGAVRWIGLRAHLQTGSHGEEVVLSVSDRGIGVRRGDQPRLFEPFFRGAEALGAGIGGSGLGLAVVRGIVEAHGGHVTVDSAPGKGSTFSMRLPVSRSGLERGAAS